MYVPVMKILRTYNRFPSKIYLWKVRSIKYDPCPENLRIELEKSKDTRKAMRMAYLCDRNFKKREMSMPIVSRATIIDLPAGIPGFTGRKVSKPTKCQGTNRNSHLMSCRVTTF